MSVLGYCTIAGAVLLASALQSSIGFGIGLLAAPIVALIEPGLIPGTLIMIAMVVTLIVVIREREDIDLHGTGWALVGRVPGTIAGALLLAMLPHRALAILLARCGARRRSRSPASAGFPRNGGETSCSPAPRRV